MNAKTLIAASLFTLIGTSAAFAQDITVDTSPVASTTTRAQVLADLAKARANGELDNRGPFYAQPNFASTPSTKTRADAKQEVVQARANGTLDTRGDLYGGSVVSTSSGKTRAEVKAEVNRAVSDHARLSQGEKSNS